MYNSQVDWDKGLPLDILSEVAGGRDERKAMREVSRTWKTGYECSVASIKISKDGPVLPAKISTERFPKLTALDLGESPADTASAEASLATLGQLGKLRSLKLGCSTGQKILMWGLQPLLLALGVKSAGLEQLCELAQLARLDLGGCRRLTDAGLAQLRELPQLTDLSLRGCWEITDGGLTALSGLRLARLDISRCHELTLDGLEVLRGNTSLTDLSLRGVCGTGIAPLAGIPLTRLDLEGLVCLFGSGSHLAEEALGPLVGMPLRDLSLTYQFRISDRGLKALQGMPLVRLSLRDCELLTAAGLQAVRGAPISDLDLGGCVRLGEAALGMLAGMPLTALGLGGCGWLTSGGLLRLRGLSLLARLDLGDCPRVEEEGLEHLRGLPLTSLSLARRQVRDRDFPNPQFSKATFKKLSGMPLQDLDLCGCSWLKPAGLAPLRELPLSRLDLSGCREMDDRCVPYLLNLPLTDLSLSESAGNLTFGGLGSLVVLPLKRLAVFELDAQTAGQLRNLLGSKVKVIH